MAKDVAVFSPGDWVVHRRYGIGEIVGTEMKEIGGPASEYYRIETDNSTIWIPTDQMDEELFRPLASRSQFQKALDVLKRPARPMKSNFRSRRQRIQQVKSENSLIDIARLVRDLWARKQEKSLTNTEESALRRFSKRFLAEWSVTMGCEVEEARKRMYTLLRQARRAEAYAQEKQEAVV